MRPAVHLSDSSLDRSQNSDMVLIGLKLAYDSGRVRLIRLISLKFCEHAISPSLSRVQATDKEEATPEDLSCESVTNPVSALSQSDCVVPVPPFSGAHVMNCAMSCVKPELYRILGVVRCPV